MKPYYLYLHLLFFINHLWIEGRGDSPEADELRDEMDAPWLLLTDEEQESLRQESKALAENYLHRHGDCHVE